MKERRCSYILHLFSMLVLLKRDVVRFQSSRDVTTHYERRRYEEKANQEEWIAKDSPFVAAKISLVQS